MTDWGMSGRRDSYEFRLVDPFTLQETGGSLEVVDGSSNVTWGEDTDNLVSASIHVAGAVPGGRLVRVHHAISLPDGTDHSEVLGTFFLDFSDEDAMYGSVDLQASAYSTLIRFTDCYLVQDFVRGVGTNIVDEVRDIVEADGGRLRVGSAVDTTQTHTIPIWFGAGTVRSEVLETIAGWTGCELGVDDNGYVTWDKYVPPLSRAVKYRFEAGANCTYLPGYKASDNGRETYNRVVAEFSRQSKQDGDPYPLADSAFVDLPDSHPYSYARIGRRKDYHLDVSDPCTHSELQSQAKRYLYEHSGGVRYYEIEHVGIPGLRTGDRVEWVNEEDGARPLRLSCIVDQISMDLGPGAMCKTKLKAIDYATTGGYAYGD